MKTIAPPRPTGTAHGTIRNHCGTPLHRKLDGPTMEIQTVGTMARTHSVHSPFTIMVHNTMVRRNYGIARALQLLTNTCMVFLTGLRTQSTLRLQCAPQKDCTRKILV